MITVKGGGGVLNNPPVVSDLQVVGEPTQTSISISYKVTDAELQITRHYLTVNGVYDKKEITKEVGYEMPDNLFTYTITGLTKGTEYTIQIMCDDGHGQGNSNPLQVSTKDSILYSFTINEADSNPRTRVTYGDEAVGVSPATSNSLGGWEDKWPFNVIRIVGMKAGKVYKEVNKTDRTKYIDGTSVDTPSVSSKDAINIFTEFPTIYWRKSAPSGNIKYEISDAPLVGGDCYAHNVGGAVRPNIYVGDYLAHSYSYSGEALTSSMPNETPTANSSLSNFRTYAHNLGSGYELLNFNILTMLQILFTLAYRNTDSQAVLGRGYVGMTSTTKTGGTNTKGWVFGDPNSGGVQMCFLGVEDLWGNLYQWVDGLYADAGYNIWLCTDNVHFNDTGTGEGWENVGTSEVKSDSGFMQSSDINTKTGFFPKSIKGASTTYYSDIGTVVRPGFAEFGGSWLAGVNAGIFNLITRRSRSEAYTTLGARLVYIGEVS